MHLRADPACSSWRYRGFKDAREKSTPASMVDPAGRATGIILQFFLHPYRCEVDPEHGTAGDVCQDVTLPVSTSAPIAGGATAGLTGLLFTSSLSNSILVVVPVGVWAKVSIPAFRACSGSGGSAAGRQRRSSTCPEALLVNLPRRAAAQALVLALCVVKV